MDTTLRQAECEMNRDAKKENQAPARLLDKTYASLGEMTPHKKWLAMAMAKTLKEHAYTPWDFIADADDATFIRATYKAMLGRWPSPDDLKFRLEELKAGKSREDFFAKIFGAPEHKQRKLHDLADLIKHGEVE